MTDGERCGSVPDSDLIGWHPVGLSCELEAGHGCDHRCGAWGWTSAVPTVEHPTPAGWPSAFNPAAAEALIAATLEEFGNAPGICDLVCELRWAIAQIRAERATMGGAR